MIDIRNTAFHTMMTSCRRYHKVPILLLV